jgi:hypothetical protein
MSLEERRKAMNEMAARINAGRKPKFGDLMCNLWAGDTNPNKFGMFVRQRRVTGRMNPGLWFELTDGSGKFWETNGEATVFASHLKGDEVLP